ncbi:unnamed protein product [Clonostachys solani]|uniref:FAD-binding PCMH-type domain-containing protein n=1 Tax=Clonostachys solani TaxID=160281 RepID=A0A9P0EJL4_9HYPO|nr:unnamed protein product [Clonostachys solani]
MSANVQSTIEAFRSIFGDRVITSAAASYEASTNQPCSAGAYVKVESAQEVADVLAIIKQTGTKFAVRSTGHNFNPGFSSCDETGIVIDLSLLQSREISADRSIAHIGAGNRWGVVYEWLEENGLSVIGGRDPSVGMGFLIGGGMGAVPNRHGLGADGIKNLQVVLSDGRIVNANHEENAELLQALKGGGTNFGIVTQIDLFTHPLIKLQYNITLYNPDNYVEINKATVKIQQEMEKDPKIGMFTNYNSAFVAVGLIYADTSEKKSEAFKAFDLISTSAAKIGMACDTPNGTLFSLAKVMSHPGIDLKRYVGTLTTKFSEELYAVAYNAWREALKTLPEGVMLHYTIQPLGPDCVTAGEAKGGNIMGLEKVSQVWWVFTVEWPQEGSDEAAQKAVDSCIDALTASAKSQGLLLNYLCASFANLNQDVIHSYGAENVKKMREVSHKYDPEQLFQKLQNNGFLLRDA